jgi:exopolysaccharide biosynthesis polyprenyl glycosylphosphotransferase
VVPVTVSKSVAQGGGEVLAERVNPRDLAWVRAYARRVFVTDLLIIEAAVFGSQLIRFGFSQTLYVKDASGLFSFVVQYNAVSAMIVVGWLLSLEFFGARDHRIIGSGSAEYKAIVDATIRLFGLFAIIVYLAQAQVGRSYLLMALPTGLLLLLLSRWLWRQWLIGKRAHGEYIYRVLLLGQRAKVEHVAESIQREGSAGLLVVGAVTQGGDVDQVLRTGTPVLGGFTDVLRVIDEARIDTLILTSADDITPKDMRRLGWDLESRQTNLIVAPALTDVAGPRIHARPVAGLPLIYVDYPSFEGRKHSTKRAFDIVAGGILLVLLSPVFLWIAIAVRLDSTGPAFFRQERVGFKGRLFRMVKFRSMVADAEAMQPSLLDQSDGNGVIFKLKDDPRVTKLGALLRKYSLDELPQLLNVIGGSMSLVGPRPHPASDVLNYEARDMRRLLVRPGMTGLWQVGGRSGLSWEESVRLDLYYVENWSLMGDLVILWRTIKAVARPEAAY